MDLYLVLRKFPLYIFVEIWFHSVKSFAGLYPDKVGRLLIDGVVNVIDWYAGRQPFIVN
jgi:hypothetical protein